MTVALLGVGTVGALLTGPATEREVTPAAPEAAVEPVVTALVPTAADLEDLAPEPDETAVDAPEPTRSRHAPPPVAAAEAEPDPEEEAQVPEDPPVAQPVEESEPEALAEVPEPEPVAEERPAPRRRPVAMVTYSGADAIRLVGQRRTYPAGEVPPGRYTVEATFGSLKVNAATLSLRAGETWELRCDRDFTICRARKK